MTITSIQTATARESARSSDGKFGHQAHDRAGGVELGVPADQGYAEWDGMADELARGPLVLDRENIADWYCGQVEIGDGALTLEDRDGRTFARLTREYGPEQFAAPDFRAFLTSRGAEQDSAGAHSVLSEQVEVDSLDPAGLGRALEAIDGDREFRGGADGEESRGFERYSREAEQTRKSVSDDAAKTLYQSALDDYEERADEDQDDDEDRHGEQPDASDQLGDIEASEGAFLRENWDVVQEAASAEGVPAEKIAQDITHFRLWSADVNSDHASPAFQQLIDSSREDRLIADCAPVLNDDGQIIWE